MTSPHYPTGLSDQGGSVHTIKESLHNYLLTREKPPGNPVPFADIEKAADVSLFKWVYRDGLSQLGLTQPTPNSCWLFTDDGSGEVADFVLLDLTNATSPKLTLIHVKGAGSESPKRLPSPGAYEVVSAQAMKNLRRMQAGNLYEEIEKTLRSGAVKRVWDQPWQQAANTSTTATTDFLSAVGQLNSIASTVKHEVIIVQPHVLKSKYKPTGAKKKWATATQQLRALLFGVQAMAKSASADFRVVADMR